MKIKSLKAEKILDSRGEWTNRAVVELDNGSKGFGEVPSGASRSEKEAALLPVDQAILHINEILAPKVIGLEAEEQETIDKLMIEIDGTKNKSGLGANATLAVSLAVCEAAAASSKIPLYKYISKIFNFEKNESFPSPLFNIINGGAHAGGSLDIQEFMVAPATHKKFPEALEMGVAIYHNLESILEESGHSTEVGDEGGFAPEKINTFSACDFLMEAVRKSGFNPGSDFFLALDIAANGFSSGNSYSLKDNPGIKDAKDLTAFYKELCNIYPVIYLEDPFQENDFESWSSLVTLLGEKTDIVGDDLTATNALFLDKAVAKKSLTGVIVKPNQIGTLWETIEFVKKAQDKGLMITVSHRSGETGEDTFIADLSVAVGARYIKAGAPARGERVVKYNRLLEIYNESKKL